MLSIRKKIALSAGLAMAATGVVASVQAASPATSMPLSERPVQTSVQKPAQKVAQVSARRATLPISIVPGAIGPGSTPKNANSAKWAVIARYGAAKAGMAVKLQKQSGASWVTVAKGRIDRKGVALFAVPPASTSNPITYRIDGPGSPTASASTSLWGTPADFLDQFGGTALSSNWSHRSTDYMPASRRTCSKASPKAVKIGGGVAALSHMLDKSRTDLCKPEKPGKPGIIFGKFRYRLNANIGTQGKKTFLYGVAAARIKFNPLQGQHASFWLQPDDITLDTTLGQEVDVIEWFGKGLPSGGLTSFVYAPSRNGQKYGIGRKGFIVNPNQYLMNAKDAWWKKYHVFSVEWSPDQYVFRIDGKETGRLRKSQIGGATASTPEYPILSILPSDYELAKLPNRDEKNNLPQTIYVDWVKTWQNPAFIPPPAP